MSSDVDPVVDRSSGLTEAVNVAQADLARAVRTLFSTGVMSASGHGNVSVRVPGHPDLVVLNAGELLTPIALGDNRITPPGRRSADDRVVVLSLDGEVVVGAASTTVSPIFRMHTEVYRERPGVNAVIHTHSPHATSFALAGQSIPARYEALLVHGQNVDVPVVPWAPRGSAEAVTGIVDTLRANPASYALLLGNHGLLVGGDDADHAATLVVALEEAATSTIGALPLGGARPFPVDVAGLDLRLRH